MLFFFVLDCQNRMISEINANTCIAFTKPNSSDAMYIKRYMHSLCVFINNEIFPNPSAWNRTFSCPRPDSTLSVCFSNTMASDAGVFNLIVGSVQRNTTTLEVECKKQKKVDSSLFIVIAMPKIKKAYQHDKISFF